MIRPLTIASSPPGRKLICWVTLEQLLSVCFFATQPGTGSVIRSQPFCSSATETKVLFLSFPTMLLPLTCGIDRTFSGGFGSLTTAWLILQPESGGVTTTASTFRGGTPATSED